MHQTRMFYFAYGSNMSSRRLKARLPSARFESIGHLEGHELRFHKIGADKSAKCDAHETGNPAHWVIGTVFTIHSTEKPLLDAIEGVGFGYEEKKVELVTPTGDTLAAMTYYATRIDPALKPFEWYKHHVLFGAREHGLPDSYVARIARVESRPDSDRNQHQAEMSIYM